MNPFLKSKRLLNFTLWVFLLLLLGGVIFIAYFFYNLQPVNSMITNATVQFSIQKGEGIKEIGAALSQKSLIKSIGVFKMYALLTGAARNFKPGVYELNQALSLPQIVNILTRGISDDIRVVITEGLTMKDIESVLKSAGALKKEESFSLVPPTTLIKKFPFLENIEQWEGFLFPDTYRFKPNSSAVEILERFLENFEIKAWSLLSGQPHWYEDLIIASLLEKEVPDFNDQRLVAGILLKRLKENIPLQVDATIVYAKCGYRFNSCSSLTIIKKDLDLVSPYNTYRRLGLPPTPIANPGQTSIRAALMPQESAYWYYLSTPHKETLFSKTLDEHNSKRAKYLN